jgi:hypothetical protein
MTTNADYTKVFFADLSYMHELSWPITIQVYKEDIIVDKEKLTTFESLIQYLACDLAKGFELAHSQNLNEWKYKFHEDIHLSKRQTSKLIGGVMFGTGSMMISAVAIPAFPLMASLMTALILSSYASSKLQANRDTRVYDNRLITLSDKLSLNHQADILSVFCQKHVPIETLMTWYRANSNKGISVAQLQAVHTKQKEEYTSPNIATDITLWGADPKEITYKAQAASTLQLLKNENSALCIQELASRKQLEDFYQWISVAHPQFKKHFSFTKKDLALIDKFAKQYLESQR